MNNTLRNCTIIAALLWAPLASAQSVPTAISFTARLTEQDGKPVSGSLDLKVSVYDAESGGSRVWQEDQVSIDADASGVIVHELGRQSANQVLDATVFNGRELFLDVIINGEQLTPRVPILSVPYAMRAAVAATAETLGDLTPESVALATHDHDARYLRRGPPLSCPTGQVAIGLQDDQGVAAPICQMLPEYTAGAGMLLSNREFSLAPNSVSAANIVDNSVTNDDIANNAVTSTEIATSSVGADELSTASVGSDEIASAAVDTDEIADGSITRIKLTDPIPVFEEAQGCVPGQAVLALTFVQQSCTTIACAASTYYTCTGACSASGPRGCVGPLVGYLAGP